MRVPFVVYADFECSTKKIDTKPPDDKSKSLFTQKYQAHKPSAFCYYIKCFDDILFPPKLVQYIKAQSEEEDIPQMFLDSLEADIDKIDNKFKFRKKALNKNKNDQDKYDNATHCHICQEELGKDKVWDHCHHRLKGLKGLKIGMLISVVGSSIMLGTWISSRLSIL